MDFKNFLISALGTGLDIIAGVLTIKIFIDLVSAKSKMMQGMRNGAKGLTQKVRDRAQASSFYQSREMGRNQRKAERQRSAVSKYASAITYEGSDPLLKLRAARMRQRAGGFNAEAQNRAYVSGLGQLEKLESQETKDAEFVLKSRGIQIPMELAAIASGDDARAVRGLSGKGNQALQRAAIRKIIAAQDAEALEDLYKSDTSNKEMVVQEVRDNYSTAKGAGAHIVKLEAKQYDPDQLADVALEQLTTLSAAKLAGQDGPAVASALKAYLAGRGTTAQRDKFISLTREIRDEPTIVGSVKGSARTPLAQLLTSIGDTPGKLAP